MKVFKIFYKMDFYYDVLMHLNKKSPVSKKQINNSMCSMLMLPRYWTFLYLYIVSVNWWHCVPLPTTQEHEQGIPASQLYIVHDS